MIDIDNPGAPTPCGACTTTSASPPLCSFRIRRSSSSASAREPPGEVQRAGTLSPPPPIPGLDPGIDPRIQGRQDCDRMPLGRVIGYSSRKRRPWIRGSSPRMTTLEGSPYSWSSPSRNHIRDGAGRASWVRARLARPLRAGRPRSQRGPSFRPGLRKQRRKRSVCACPEMRRDATTSASGGIGRPRAPFKQSRLRLRFRGIPPRPRPNAQRNKRSFKLI